MVARRVLIPAAVFTAFAAVLVASFAVVSHQTREQQREKPYAAAAQSALRLRDFVKSRLLALETLVPQIEAGRLRDRASFGSAAAALYDGFPGFHAINWTSPDGVLQWVNPPGPNAAAQGKSVFEHAQAGPFARQAAAGTDLVLTGPVVLFQGMPGVVAYVPVREDGSLLGLVNGVFSVEEMVQAAFDRGLLDDYELRIADGSRELYSSAGFRGAVDDERTVGQASIAIAGRQWQLELVPSDAFWASASHSHSPLFLLSLVLAAGLALFVAVALAAQRKSRSAARARAQLAELVNASIDPMALLEPDGRFRYMNRSARALAGLGADDLPPRALDILSDESRDQLNYIRKGLRENGHWEGEVDLALAVDAPPVPVYARAFVIPAPDAQSKSLVGLTCLDLRDQKRLQLELQHANKMESVGRLAGGVAHDFNNLLTAMTSYATLLRCSDELPASLTPDVDEILATAQRGASLTRQLLTFARKETSEPTEVDVGGLLRGMKRLMRRVLRADIRLNLNVSQATGTCFIDATQFEQAILNLCINSIDAMPRGGELTVSAERCSHDGEDSCCVIVRDTGVGMSQDVAEKVFDPFFTTKPVGKGTGLGLSSVYGLVTGAGGTVTLDTELGVGTAFTIRLPRTGNGRASTENIVTPVPTLGPVAHDDDHKPRVLLVEDEKSVRRASRKILERGGLEVVAVSDGVEAMNHLAEDKRDFDLIVSDVVMPRMGGLELVERLRDAGVTIPVLLCSGYNDQDLRSDLLDRLGCERLEKPFPPSELLERAERLITGPGGSRMSRANPAT